MSSFTDTKEREQTGRLRHLLLGGHRCGRSGPASRIDPNNACGKKVAVQATTTEETDELPAKSKACTDAGKPADRDPEVRRPGRGHQRRGARPGRRDVGGFPGDAVRDQAEQRQARSRPARSSTAAPYGWPVKKGSPLAQSLQQALEHLIETGDYKQIATNWGVENGHDRQAGHQRRDQLTSGIRP